ncbi:oxidoreductase [Fredinandcohnia sp. 179-A 10B2 NHS]|uniref:oxidoreductase n=1 Tax=Fredinandcohnia sp. 179-A 10B2 NHS TaxID=3235176 RepID=UPI0039A1EDB3
MGSKKAVIAGATGLIGNKLLRVLINADEYEKVYAFVRRPLGINHPKLEEVQVDFSHLENYREYLAVEDVFICLGTTIKKAKTQEAMYKVDVEYPVEIARLAKEAGAAHYLLVSSMNANPKSPIFYSRMKGELEEKVTSLGYKHLSIFRPSLLLGDRQEFRLGEEFAAKLYKVLGFVFVGPMRKYKAIEGQTVAKAMYKVAQNKEKGKVIYSSEGIAEIGR